MDFDPDESLFLWSYLRGLRRHDLVGPEASRQIPSLAKLEKEPKVKTMWEKGASGDWHADYKGISIRIKVDPETGKPMEICWYVGGVLSEISPVTCNLSVAQKIAVKIVDIQIPKNPHWAQAEERWQRGFFLTR